MNERNFSQTTAVRDRATEGTLAQPRPPEVGQAGPAAVPARPKALARPSGWTGGRIAALLIGALLGLFSLALLSSGAAALWADWTQRDTGYVTSGVHQFSTSGSALATERVDLGSPGVNWLYSGVVFGEVRIRVTPASPGSTSFVGIGPSADVDRYLAGVGHTAISDFWGNRVQSLGGGTVQSAPGTQTFWAASATGSGAQTLTWNPANGSWKVVVMNADGRPGVTVAADLGARMPALLGIAVALLAAGAVFAVGGASLIVGAIGRASRSAFGKAAGGQES